MHGAQEFVSVHVGTGIFKLLLVKLSECQTHTWQLLEILRHTFPELCSL